MQLESLLTPARTQCGAPGSSKKRVLENIAHFISQDIPNLNVDDLFNSLIARERLGSTGLGNGIAIPHCRIAHCSTTVVALFSLKEAIDFDAVDGEPVDLLFVLLVPEEAHDEHLTVLAELARRFNDPSYCQQLRQATDSQSLFDAACKEL